MKILTHQSPVFKPAIYFVLIIALKILAEIAGKSHKAQIFTTEMELTNQLKWKIVFHKHCYLRQDDSVCLMCTSSA